VRMAKIRLTIEGEIGSASSTQEIRDECILAEGIPHLGQWLQNLFEATLRQFVKLRPMKCPTCGQTVK
jgi:hypothetical protein